MANAKKGACFVCSCSSTTDGRRLPTEAQYSYSPGATSRGFIASFSFE